MEVTPREVHEVTRGRREMNYEEGEGKTSLRMRHFSQALKGARTTAADSNTGD